MHALDVVATEHPRRLSRQLRRSRGAAMRRRRGIVALSFVAAGCMQVVALYQIGILRRVPEPDLDGLDADEVDASEQAYERFEMGDGFLGFVSYAATAALAAMGSPDRARRRPWIPVALGAKALADAAVAAKLTRDQWSVHRGFCSYCLVAAGATFASAELAAPETAEGLRRLFARRG